MKVIFMGTSEFAVAPLAKVASAHDMLAVFTKADSVKNRGKKLEPTPVKVLAEELGIDVYTPSTLKAQESVDLVKGINPDIIIVASYGMILPASILEIPKFGCVNIHASLLPKWRGASPVERAILAGESEQGVSIMRMEEGLDTGDFCAQKKFSTVGMNAEEVLVCLSNLGADILLDSLSQIEDGSVSWVHQNEDMATYAHKIEKGELNIRPDCRTKDNYFKVLASSDSHVSKCCINGRPARIINCELSDIEIEPGNVRLVNGELLLGCVDGALSVNLVKPDGKKEMDAKSFAAGIQGIKQGNIEWSAI